MNLDVNLEAIMKLGAEAEAFINKNADRFLGTDDFGTDDDYEDYLKVTKEMIFSAFAAGARAYAAHAKEFAPKPKGPGFATHVPGKLPCGCYSAEEHSRKQSDHDL